MADLTFYFDFFFGFLTDLKAVLSDEEVYNEAAMEAFPVYNKFHMICLEMPSRAGDVSCFFENIYFWFYSIWLD